MRSGSANPAKGSRRRGPSWCVVLVLRKEPADWGLKRATLGVVMKGEDDRMDTAIVFAPGVFRVLGYEAGLPGACSEPEELRSVARVALHEVIHVIAPGHEHAGEGLMSERLDRGKLLKRELSIDANCLLAFREGVEASRFEGRLKPLSATCC